MLVFTNGCFDIIHAGHVDLLQRARAMGDRLIIGLNSDRSVRAIKGPDRPVQNEDARKSVLLALRSVDDVIIFDELTPEKLIESICPDVLVKGGDWRSDEIIGADFVLARGGQVHSLHLKEGFSSSSIIEKLEPSAPSKGGQGTSADSSIDEHIKVIKLTQQSCTDAIDESFRLIIQTLDKGGKVLICGNGGSAADAQHLAAEFAGRYETERRALKAVALTTDTSALTAIANDYGFERIFSRQVEALADPGDCLIAISTSGTSPNIIAAVMEARRRGCRVIGMTGKGGKKLASLSDSSIVIPSDRTARVQEAHITIAHVWCEMIDEWIAAQN
jgi:D-sedoheptulose 7-phosphate isomerase